MNTLSPAGPAAKQALTLDDHQAAQEVTALAARWRRANGPLMSGLNRLGGKLEQKLVILPESLRSSVESLTLRALERAYGLAGTADRLPDPKGRASMAAMMVSGAAGGVGGLPTAVAELPFTVTLLLSAIRREAEAAGLDPDHPWIRAEALRVLASGSPAEADDGIDTAFVSARLALNGPALQKLISTVAPKLATALGQKLAAQAVPVIGAVSGAAINAAFLRYYREMAAIRFALLALSEQHGAAPVLTAFKAQTAERPRLGRKGA